MKIDLRPRGGGKTNKMIEDAASGFFYIVCHSQQEAYRISQLAIEMGIDIPFPLTYDEFISRKFNGAGIKGFLIDNTDMLLSHMAGSVPVIGISMTCPNPI